MKIQWKIDQRDVQRARLFFDEHRKALFVRKRIERNLRRNKPPVTKTDFWRVMVGCLLTTQQRSGPDTPVSRFLLEKPFPLSYHRCLRRTDLAKFARDVLAEFGGLRRSTTIGEEMAANMEFLAEGGWKPTLSHLENVRLNSRPETERRAAEFIDESYRGFGPKQSRNLLQGLRLSRYEIPLDSRITKWLNGFGFPIKLTASALSDRSYYNFVSDGFQRLCMACRIKPAVMDAAIFSSFDNDEWTEGDTFW
jgi:hypothetical protein